MWILDHERIEGNEQTNLAKVGTETTLQRHIAVSHNCYIYYDRERTSV